MVSQCGSEKVVNETQKPPRAAHIKIPSSTHLVIPSPQAFFPPLNTRNNVPLCLLLIPCPLLRMPSPSSLVMQWVKDLVLSL